MADGEMSAADSNTSLQRKKSGYTFGQNETLLLISLYQKYKENCCDNGCNGSLFVGRHICYAMFTWEGPTGDFLCRQSELFLAFRTNHSYSRIVDKKTRPKFSYATDVFKFLSFKVITLHSNVHLHSYLTPGKAKRKDANCTSRPPLFITFFNI